MHCNQDCVLLPNQIYPPCPLLCFVEARPYFLLRLDKLTNRRCVDEVREVSGKVRKRKKERKKERNTETKNREIKEKKKKENRNTGRKRCKETLKQKTN